MSEVYTVTVNNSTPTEITGGRVGSFFIEASGGGLYLGGEALTVSPAMFPSDPPVQTGLNAVNAVGVTTSGEWFYVTSPDEVYAISVLWSSDNPTREQALTIFHCR